MKFRVTITEDAEHDLEDIYEFIRAQDGARRANQVLDKIVDRMEQLADMPARGVYPKELATIGIREYREVFFKPYRVIYRVVGDQVAVVLIADGRRDMRTLLQQRLLLG